VKPTLQDLYRSSHLSGGNASFVEAMYEDWLADEDSVPSQWAALFANLRGDVVTETGRLGVQEKFRQLGRLPSAIDTQLADRKEAAVVKLISAYRLRGHENARLNPLDLPHAEPVEDLDPAFHGLDESDLDGHVQGYYCGQGALCRRRRRPCRDCRGTRGPVHHRSVCGTVFPR